MTHTAQQQGLREVIAKLINDKVDWAEWGKGDEAGLEITDSILQQVIEWVEERRDEIGEERDWYEKNIILNRIISELKGELS